MDGCRLRLVLSFRNSSETSELQALATGPTPSRARAADL
jgi:hypothetical protein